MTAEKIKHWQDPYEPTPEGFHIRVENTLRSLQKKENAAVPRIPVRRAVVLAALLAASRWRARPMRAPVWACWIF